MKKYIERLWNGLVKENPVLVLMLGRRQLTMKKYIERLWNGLVKENPVLVLMLGMCPALAVSTQAANGIGMGLSTLAVLVLSNFVISCLRKVIPDQVRLPAYIVIVASLVTVTELLIEAYLPSLYEALGIYIPLIVVNCIILGRAEAYANKHTPLLSVKPPGAFLVFALIIAVMNAIGIKTRQRKLVESGCDGNCAACGAVCETRDTEPAAATEEKGGEQV